MPQRQSEFSAKPVSIGFGLGKANQKASEIDMVGIAAGQQHTMI